jgi:ABC-type amino acid transport substrate-binding protein
MKARLVAVLGFALAALLGAVASADEDAYDKLRARGALEVAVYDRYPPYSYQEDGETVGIDVDVAAALAKALGLELKLRVARAGENMDDDLRNLIWKGSVLGGGVADLMMHVGADPEYVKRQHQVAIFAPYYHESVAVMVNPERIRSYEGIGQFPGHKVSIERDSIGDLFLSDAYNGELRETLARYPSATEAVQAFVRGDSDAVIAGRGELLGLVRQFGGKPLDIHPLLFGGQFRGDWDVGLAVKADNSRLREALAAAMGKLAGSGELAAIFVRHGVEYTSPRPSGVAGAR